MAKHLGEIIAKNIQERMTKAGMSQNELARKLDLSSATINHWLKDYAVPRQDKLDKMAELFNCTTFELTVDEHDLPQGISIRSAYPVPILGTICAGDGVICNEHYDGEFYIDSRIHADYAVRVKGDSMIGAGINSGDYALITKQFEFCEGFIYAVIIDTEVMLKRVYRQNNALVLVSANERYSPITSNEAVVIGKCIGVYHNVN